MNFTNHNNKRFSDNFNNKKNSMKKLSKFKKLSLNFVHSAKLLTDDSPSMLQDSLKTLNQSLTSSNFYLPTKTRIYYPFNTISNKNYNSTSRSHFKKTRSINSSTNINRSSNYLKTQYYVKNKYIHKKILLKENTSHIFYKKHNFIQKKCKKHSNETIKFFCIDCNKNLCNLCIDKNLFLNAHLNHRILNYDKYYEMKIPKILKEFQLKFDEMELYTKKCQKYIEMFNKEKEIVLKEIETQKNNFIIQFNNNIIKIKQMIENINDYKEKLIKEKSKVEDFIKNLTRDKVKELNDSVYKNFNNNIFGLENCKQPYYQKDINNLISLSINIRFQSYHTMIIKLNRNNLETNNEEIFDFKLKNYDFRASFKIQHRKDWNPESAVIYFSIPKDNNKIYRTLNGYFIIEKYQKDIETYILNQNENESFLFLSKDIPWKNFYSNEDNITIMAIFYEGFLS